MLEKIGANICKGSAQVKEHGNVKKRKKTDWMRPFFL